MPFCLKHFLWTWLRSEFRILIWFEALRRRRTSRYHKISMFFSLLRLLLSKANLHLSCVEFFLLSPFSPIHTVECCRKNPSSARTECHYMRRTHANVCGCVRKTVFQFGFSCSAYRRGGGVWPPTPARAIVDWKNSQKGNSHPLRWFFLFSLYTP